MPDLLDQMSLVLDPTVERFLDDIRREAGKPLTPSTPDEARLSLSKLQVRSTAS